MSTKYIDIKITTWKRYHLSDDTDLPVIIEKIQKENLDHVLEDLGEMDKPGFSYENLYETENMIDITDNEGFSTLEIFDENIDTNSPIYKNGK